MRKLFRKIWNDERGNMLVISGVALPLLVGAAGLATDTIQWTLWKRELQRAADSAAIAGVYDRVNAGGATTNTGSAIDRDLELNYHVAFDMLGGYPQVSYPADTSTERQQVQVTLAVQRKLGFSGMFMESPPLIQASATAASVPGTDSYCVVSLEDTTKTGIEGSGNAHVEFSCGLITNSVSTNAATAKGSSYIKATTIAASGGIQESDNWDVDKYDPYVPAQDDPYGDLNVEPSDTSGCAANPPALVGGALGTTGNPGCYSSISVGSNKYLKLNAGTYIITGKNASTAGSVSVQGTLTSDPGVTIVLTNKDTSSTAKIGTFDSNAQASIDLSAPATGKWAGIAIYQDRRAVTDTGAIAAAPNKINGGATGNVEGVLYFPKQSLAFLGNSSDEYICTQFVVRRIVFTGTNGSHNKFDDDCPGMGLEKVEGGRRVRLIA